MECSNNPKFSKLIEQTNLWPCLPCLFNLLAVKKSDCLFCSGVESRVQVGPAFVLHRRRKESAEAIHLTSGKVVMPQGGKIVAAVPAALLNLSPSIAFNEDWAPASKGTAAGGYTNYHAWVQPEAWRYVFGFLHSAFSWLKVHKTILIDCAPGLCLSASMELGNAEVAFVLKPNCGQQCSIWVGSSRADSAALTALNGRSVLDRESHLKLSSKVCSSSPHHHTVSSEPMLHCMAKNPAAFSRGMQGWKGLPGLQLAIKDKHLITKTS